MNYELDNGIGDGTRVGAIILTTDETLEYEARQVLAGRGVNLMHARIPSEADVTPETLRAMAASMTATAELLPRGLHSIAYGCTSASTVIGPDEVARLIGEAHPGTPVANPISSVMDALGALGASRIALVTPYVPSVTAPMRALLAENGIETVSEVSFGEGDDWKVARISEASTRAAMLEAGRAEGVEAIFASCTNLRTFGIIDAVEDELGVPVISSNLALTWNMLRLAGVDAKGWGPGRLYRI